MYFILSVILVSLTLIGFIIYGILSNHIVLGIILGIIGFIVVLALFCCAILIALCIRGKKYAGTYDPKDSKRWRFMNNISDFCIKWLNIKIHIKGIEKLDTNSTFCFYSNHQSFLDIPVYDIVLKDYKRGSLYKIEHSQHKVISGMVKALGGVGIDRNDDRQAARGIIESIKEVKSGVNFMIYPEGTRSQGKNLNTYHAGSFKIAQKSGAKLAVLALDGNYKRTRAIPLVRTNVYVEVVKVYDNEEISSISSIELADKVKNLTIEAINNARKEYKFLSR